jgi:hypothetical protein
MIDLGTFLQSLGPAIEIAKRVASKDETLQLVNVLAQSRLLASDNAELQGRVIELERKLQFQGTLRYERNVYRSDDPRDPGPFCPACWDGKKTAVHLIDRNTASANHFKCEVCDKYFDASGERRSDRTRPRGRRRPAGLPAFVRDRRGRLPLSPRVRARRGINVGEENGHTDIVAPRARSMRLTFAVRAPRRFEVALRFDA